MTKYSISVTELIDLPPGIDSVKESLAEVIKKIGLTNIDISFSEAQIPSTDFSTFSVETQEELDALFASQVEPQLADDSDGNIIDEEPELSSLIEPDILSAKSELLITLHLQALSELIINLPFLEGISLVLNPGGFDVKVFLDNCNFNKIGTTIGIGVRFSKEYLKPMKKNNDTYEPDNDVEYVQIDIAEATISVDSNGNIDFEGGLGFQIEGPVMIGDTGIILENVDVELNLSGEGSHPDGTPEGWKGLMINSAKLSIPDIFDGSIEIDGLGIGSGGVSGNISANSPITYSNGELTGQFVGEVFGMYGGLESIELSLQQNLPAGGGIRLKVLLPFFEETDRPLDIQITISADGTFAAEISSEDGILELEKEDILKLNVDSIGFGLDNGTWAATIAGKIKPLIGGLEWPDIEIKALTIDSKGNVSVDGGWIDIPKQLSMDFHGFKLELTELGFGQEDSGAKWIGLSGGINIVEGIPLKGGVDGLKIIWMPDGSFGLEISGINVSFEIEDVLKFEGKVYFIDEPQVKGFKGGIKMVLYPLDGMKIDAQFIAGKNTENPPFNFFYIFIGLDLPVGIPLGNTGAALYGMAGLFGYNMLMDKRTSEAWFEDDQGNDGFYKRSPEGITDIEKWTYVREGLAFGAGVTLGTASDNGFTFSGRVLLVIMIPGPVIVVEGKATMLQERSGLSGDEAPFRMLAVLDCKNGELLINIDAKYKLPEGDGSIIDVSGSVDVYFNFNDPNIWHIYLGQKEPLSKRLSANIIGMLKANAYLMIDPDMFDMGAWASIFYGWNIEILKVGLFASIEGNLGMSYKPVQAWGSMSMEIGLVIQVFSIGFKFSIFAGLEVTTPNPWSVKMDFKVTIDVPWPFDDIEARIVLEWKEHKVPPIPNPLSGIGIEHLKVTEKWDLNTLGSELDSSKTNSPLVPLDARPVLIFEKPVEDGPGVGGGSSTGLPPYERSDDYLFRYRIKRITLYRQAKYGFSTWTRVAESVDDVSGSGVTELEGEWQTLPDGNQKNTKLMMWANTPFDIFRQHEESDGMIIRLIEAQHRYPCPLDVTGKLIYVDFEELGYDKKYFPLLYHERFLFFSIACLIKVVYKPSKWGTKLALTLEMPEKIADFNLEAVLGEGRIMAEKMAKKTAQAGNAATGTLVVEETLVKPLSHGVVPGPTLEIILPGQMAEVELYFTSGSNGKVTMFRGPHDEIGAKAFDYSGIDDNDMSVFNLKSEEKDIIALHVSGKFKIAKIGCLTRDESISIEYNERVNGYKQTEILSEQWIHTGPVLEPNCYYKLEVVTETLYKYEIPEMPAIQFPEMKKQHTNFAYFQTRNPPGVYDPAHPDDSELTLSEDSEHYPSRGPLKDLTPYVLSTIPEQAASNEPQRPAYRSYDVGITFNESRGYVEQMYLMAGLPPGIRLFDNNDKPVCDLNGLPVVLENKWGDNPALDWTREEEQWHSILTKRCNMVVEDDLEANKKVCDLFISSQMLVMKPKTRYKARLFAGDEYSVYEFGFVTSRFCTFVHHIHSFDNAVWDLNSLAQITALDPDLLNDALSEVGESESHLHSNYHRELEAQKFDEIISSGCLDFGTRQLPEKIEISAINDDDHIYGLLLESPEPLDWKRIDLAIKKEKSIGGIHVLPSAAMDPGRIAAAELNRLDLPSDLSPVDESIPEAMFCVKIIHANIVAEGARTDNFNDEYLEIIVREQCDLSGHQILFKAHGEEEFEQYYKFGPDEKFADGTVIKIHSGKEAEEQDAGIVHKYLTPDEAECTWRLDPSGGSMQIMDTAGMILHTYSTSRNKYSALKTKLVRNKDQTRALIFIPGLDKNYSFLSKGKYALEFMFRPDISDNKPLKRYGRTEIEKAQIEFSLPALLP